MGKPKTVTNSQFGEVTVPDDKIVAFPDGIIGFEELKQFVIIDLPDYEPFQWLLSIDDPEVVFPVISPLIVQADYQPSIERSSVQRIGQFEDTDLLMYAIVTVRDNGKQVTANLKGPLVINQKNRTGQQVVLESDELSTEHPFIGAGNN